MKLPPLTNGVILRRYKRFLADIELADGRIVTAHCPNTGSMRSCWEPGVPVQLSYDDNPRRKLVWTLERVDMGGGWIGVHTGRTNAIVGEVLREGEIARLSDYRSVRPEAVFDVAGLDRCRFDFYLSDGVQQDAWVEVKNVTLFNGNCLQFPDAITLRGRKHLEMLARARQLGYRAVMLYALNRPEGGCFTPADDIDPAYAATLRRVIREDGVEALALRITHAEQSMRIGGEVALNI